MPPPPEPVSKEPAADPATFVPAFLPRWLSARIPDGRVVETVSKLLAEVPGLLRPPAAGGGPALGRRFLDELGSRLDALEVLAARFETEAPPAPPASARGRWQRAARRIGACRASSEPGDRLDMVLEVSRAGNPLMLAIVSQSLDEAFAMPGPSRQVASLLAQLRGIDESEFRQIGLPPAPGAPWRPDDYLFPLTDRTLVQDVRARLATWVSSGPATPGDGPADLHLQPFRLAVASQLRAFDDNWPLSRAQLVQAVRRLAEAPGAPPCAREALALLDLRDGTGNAEPIPDSPPPPPPDDPRALARARWAELIGQLLNHASTEARAFGQRLQDLGAAVEFGDEEGRQLVGGLVFLDELARGPGEPRGWAKPTAADLAAIGAELGLCVILGQELIGQPIARATELAIAVGSDEPARTGAGSGGQDPRITAVEQPGYAVLLSGGTRQVILRARVRISP